MTDNGKITRALSLLGICKKAGRLTSGVPLVCDAIREGHIRLVVYATGAAANSVKRVTDKAKSYHVEALPLDVAPEALGHAVGKSGAFAAVGVGDAGFATALAKLLQN